ncbi:phosphate transport system protein [Bacillus tianshenii]|uniref:Phosphate-specific transport system accessory protein PhoU n=1 Tax=Sutcliffiella tianshenii TaxID=1463404 RepID=A0ABS2NZW6_9BACI|nr:phosphate signaling complex protein PhoU [Bacillus tianshenii]MBM7620262.1 phosphate transport system protein [Bacillus tianshenii]
MTVRGQFQIDLNTLRDKLLELGSLAEIALGKSINTLTNKDIEQALQIIEDDYKADRLDEEINDFAILLIAKQQPVAVDLRRIIVAIKISTDVERIADFAVNIAKSTIRIGEKSEDLIPIDKIVKMHNIATEMLSLSLKAYYDEDVVLAKQVAEMDDQVDELYGENIRELLKMTKDFPDMIPQITQLSFICRYIERMADHTTNISENILYLVKGRHYELNE